MKKGNHKFLLTVFLYTGLSLLPVMILKSQTSFKKINYTTASRMYDSILAVRIPILHLPDCLRGRPLPPVVDNSKNEFWPGIQDQFMFWACQEYAGISYTFSYEINRLRNQPGWYWENTYPAHYTWNFLNLGQQIGVNFLQSFDVLRQQGNMTMNDYGADTAMHITGWPNGYERYYKGMPNRIRNVYAIPINSEEGILTMKNYLFDHLDGSPTGGVACFTTACSSFYGMSALPQGTPEAGKMVIVHWLSKPDHGLTVVGYNDSIRFDINEDGKYTNDIDINGDEIIDARDWEFGAFKLANSYGTLWNDSGFLYVLYAAMASNYEEGGVWNNRVYVIEPDSDYRPLLTMKVIMDYNLRDKIRLLAGVSDDTTDQLPKYIMEFPIFNFQGGEFPMQGIYPSAPPGIDTIEFGLDVTPLLSHIQSGLPAKFYFLTEEHDPDKLGHGSVQNVSFIRYSEPVNEYVSSQTMVPIIDNDITVVTATGSPDFDKVQITTEQLPPIMPGENYSVQLQAQNGRLPYTWSLAESFKKIETNDSLPVITTLKLQPQSEFSPYAVFKLPFSFPFYGKEFDTLYVNFYGFISFDKQTLPYPFVTDELALLKKFAIISPALSQYYIYPNGNYGVWVDSNAENVIIRWRTSLSGGSAQSDINFGLRLYHDGQADFLYGKMDDPGFSYTIYTGISKGDELNFDLVPYWKNEVLTGKSFSLKPPVIPSGIQVSREGNVSLSQADSSRIFDIGIRVCDANNLTDIKQFQLSDGLFIRHELVSGNDNLLKFGQPASLRVIVSNFGSQTLQNLNLYLKPTSPGVLLTDSLESIAQIVPGEIRIIENAFSFSLAYPFPDEWPVEFSIEASNENHNWMRQISIPVAAPDLIINTPLVLDGDNNFLDPGEFVELLTTVTNHGSLRAVDLTITLESLDTVVAMMSEPSQSIEILDAGMQKKLIYQVKASQYVYPGFKAPLRLTLSDQSGVYIVYNFELQIGKNPVAIAALPSAEQSLSAMKEKLDSLHVPYDVYTSLPFQYTDYSSLFVLLGSHVLTYQEGTNLAQYLYYYRGKLYLESYSTWYYGNNTQVHPMFHYSSEKVPYYYYKGVKGISQTFTDSLVLANRGPNNVAIFNFQPQEPAFASLVNTDDPPKNLEIAYDGDDYKTIGTFTSFGSLADSLYPSGRLSLMKRYLDFFDLNITGPYPLFHTLQTTACQGNPINFTDDSFENIISWQWEFPGAVPSLSNDRNPVVIYSTPGKYDAKLTVSDGSNTKSLLKKGYISVKNCTGVEKTDKERFVRIYPNPAKNLIWIEPHFEMKEKGTLIISDLMGRVVLRKVFSGNLLIPKIQVDCSDLQRGIYVLHIFNKDFSQIGKIIIN